MATNRTYANIVNWADAYNAQLRADDPRFLRTVLVVETHELCVTVRDAAFLVEVDVNERADRAARKTDDDLSGWVVAFAEHHPPQVWHRGDLHRWAQFDRVADIERARSMPK